jgi:hypothetical protein
MDGSREKAGWHARKIEGQIAAGTYEHAERKKWPDIRTEFELKVTEGIKPGTR